MNQANNIKYLCEEIGSKVDWNEKQMRNKPSNIESVKDIIDEFLIEDIKHPRK